LARADNLEVGLTFVGFVGIRDPLRPDVRVAVEQCHTAGIDVKMITGDNPETARAIAVECGLLNRPDAIVMTSDEFEKLSDDELKDRLPRLRVLARAKPLDKYRLVRLLQEQNHVVAMTGDGTNDAPSLRKADVGLAMGLTGTEVAKEASKIVLLDDAFGTIVKAVLWGRALYENIQKFIQFQLTINVSALTIAFVGPFLGLRPPFTVLQLLWINVIMDTFAAIALCSEPPRPELMRVPPKRRDENILTRSMLITILTTAAFFVIAMFALLLGMEHLRWFEHPPGESLSSTSDQFAGFTLRQVAIFFSVYVFFQVWNQFNCRSLTPDVSGLSGVHRNPMFLGITGLIVAGQILIVTFGGEVFHVTPLNWFDWLTIAVATMSVLVFGEITRQVRRLIERKPQISAR
jgi:Ca2+-transporting ATPase